MAAVVARVKEPAQTDPAPRFGVPRRTVVGQEGPIVSKDLYTLQGRQRAGVVSSFQPQMSDWR